ncbi:hypothetical protein [Xanthomonas oryzae]|uniref:hypothetical protein n=1 Tax=Xanthomonas oryzae TaxID=347 RepID=UPI0010347D7F|nr:hypothetical protein [Xanthomonas oryzae]QBH00482.1 hypothetical protein EYC56_15850 [Xanthomonas oryzae]
MHSNSRMGVQENKSIQPPSHFEIIKNFIEAELRGGLIIVPTTTQTVSHVKIWRELHPSIIVVAPSTGGSHTPTELLHEFGKSPNLPVLAIIFSDQLTSAQDAPVLVKKNKKLVFFSAIELIGNKKYGALLHIWLGHRVATLDRETPQIDILNLLSGYLRNCEKLGPEWIARSIQPHRYLDERRRDAMRRLRLFQSMILYSSIKDAPTQKITAALEKLNSLHRLMAFNNAT